MKTLYSTCTVLYALSISLQVMCLCVYQLHIYVLIIELKKLVLHPLEGEYRHLFISQNEYFQREAQSTALKIAFGLCADVCSYKLVLHVLLELWAFHPACIIQSMHRQIMFLYIFSISLNRLLHLMFMHPDIS